MSGPRGLNLSGAQVIASVLATLTAAVAASYLGVAGTLAGAAVGSVVSTAGTEIYKHYLQRSQERLRTAGEVLYHSAARTRTGNTMAQAGATGTSSGGRHAAPSGPAPDRAAQDLADRDTEVWDRRAYGSPRGPDETQVIPGPGTTRWDGAPDGGPATGGAAHGSPDGGPSTGAPPNEGGPGDSAGRRAHGSITPEGASGDASGHGSLWGAITSFFGGLTRREWLTYGGMAGALFLVVVAGITVLELSTGKPVSSLVSGGHAHGTSFGHVFGSSHTAPHQKATTHPTSTSSATPAGSASTSPTPSAGSPSVTPTPGTSGTPSSPSTVPSPTPSTGSSRAVRSSATATPTP